MDDERPVGVPPLKEIKQIIENDKNNGFIGLKAKINEILNNEDNSLKVIKNSEYLRSKNKMSTLSRGNFITQNRTDVHKANKRDESWQEAQTAKQTKNQTKKEMVQVRNELMMQRNRDSKLFLLQRKEILQKIKED